MSELIAGPVEVPRLYAANQLVFMGKGQVMGITKGIKNKAIKVWEKVEIVPLEYPLTFQLFTVLPQKNKIPDADCSSWVAKYFLDAAIAASIIEDDNPKFIANVICHAATKEDINKVQYWGTLSENIFKC